jgi:hypothetical protein
MNDADRGSTPRGRMPQYRGATRVLVVAQVRVQRRRVRTQALAYVRH